MTTASLMDPYVTAGFGSFEQTRVDFAHVKDPLLVFGRADSSSSPSEVWLDMFGGDGPPLLTCQDCLDRVNSRLPTWAQGDKGLRWDWTAWRLRWHQRRQDVAARFRQAVVRVVEDNRRTRGRQSAVPADPYACLFSAPGDLGLSRVFADFISSRKKAAERIRLFKYCVRKSKAKVILSARRRRGKWDPWAEFFGLCLKRPTLSDPPRPAPVQGISYTASTKAPVAARTPELPPLQESESPYPASHDESGPEHSDQEGFVEEPRTPEDDEHDHDQEEPQSEPFKPPPLELPKSASPTREAPVLLRSPSLPSLRGGCRRNHGDTEEKGPPPKKVGAKQLTDIVSRLSRPLDKKAHSPAVKELLRRKRAEFRSAGKRTTPQASSYLHFTATRLNFA